MDRETAIKLWREISQGAPDGVVTGAMLQKFSEKVEAAERERCANLRTTAAQVLSDMQSQGVLLEWQTLLEEALRA